MACTADETMSRTRYTYRSARNDNAMTIADNHPPAGREKDLHLLLPTHATALGYRIVGSVRPG